MTHGLNGLWMMMMKKMKKGKKGKKLKDERITKLRCTIDVHNLSI
jgi:hypothetical protein